MIVRDATITDLPAITDIYNDVVATSSAIWTDEPTTVAERTEWFDQHRRDGHAVVVACPDASSDAAVWGYGSFTRFRSKPGYWPTVEHSIHVGAPHRGSGAGSLILDALRERAVAAGKAVMVAGIDGANAGSIAFHEQRGFRVVGRMPAIGRKFGRPVDLVLLQHELDGPEGHEGHEGPPA